MKNLIRVCLLCTILAYSCSTKTQIIPKEEFPVSAIRVQVKPPTSLTPKWYAPQQPTSGVTTPMVTPQIIYQGPNGRGYSGPGMFGGNH